MVHRHVDYFVPKQEGSLRGENQEIPPHRLLPRVFG